MKQESRATQSSGGKFSNASRCRVAIKIPCKVFLNSDVLSFLWLFLHVELGRGVLMRSRKPLNRHSGVQVIGSMLVPLPVDFVRLKNTRAWRLEYSEVLLSRKEHHL